MLEQLQALLREFTGNEIVLRADMLFSTDLGLDSYDFIALLGHAEERFDITISDRAAMGMVTVGDLLNYLEQLK